MATILTSVTPTLRKTNFTGLSEIERANSGIARAEMVYKTIGSWSGPGVGNNRTISFTHQLDRDYGYVVMDCFARFYGANALIYMEATGEFEIQTTPGHSENEIIVSQMLSEPSRQSDLPGTAIGSIPSGNYNTFLPADAANTGSMIFRLVEPKPSLLIYPFANTSYPPAINVRFGEQFDNGNAYNYYFYLRLLQYDISQSYNYIVQTPQLTR
ncbi:MAG: hypothetical protein VW907_10835 [Opitutae bacterium]